MDEEEFIVLWNEKFPKVSAPPSRFTSLQDAEYALENHRTVTDELQEKLKQNNVYLNYLEALVSSRKKQAVSSNDVTSADVVPSSGGGSSGGSGTTQQQPDVIQQAATSSALAKRKSKVLENVKLFESKRCDEVGEVAGGLQRMSSRRRTSYLEMWECKTGSDKESANQQPSSLSRHGSVAEEGSTTKTFGPKTSSSAAAVTSAAVEGDGEADVKMMKPKISKRPPARSDYVEVWQCKSGTQVELGVVYDDQDDFRQEDYQDDEEEGEDYDINDIDMRDGYGKRHYTIGGGDVKLLDEKQSCGTRMTWPAKPPVYEEEDETMMTSSSHLEDRFSRLSFEDDCDDDDDEDYTDDGEDDSNDDDSNASNPLESPTQQSSSPYHDMRKARTTDERLGAAASFWLPSTSSSPRHHDIMGRNSMISLQSSVDIQSSDDDLLDDRTSLRSEVSENSPATPRRIPPPAVESLKSNDVSKPMPPPPPLHVKGAATAAATSSPTTAPKPTKISRSSALASSFKNENVSEMVDYQKVRNVAEAEKLRMRHWVLTSMLEMEATYLQYLNTLLIYMKPIRASIGSSRPCMSQQDYDCLFFRIPEFHELHSDFYSKLKPRLDIWSSETQVADIFEQLSNKMNLYKDYLHNYKKALQTIEKCAKENTQFSSITAELKVQSLNSVSPSEKIKLQAILYKPVERVMRTTLALQDLLKHTPHRHPDYQILRKTLKQSQTCLEKMSTNMSTGYKPRRIPTAVAAAARNADRHLIKDGYLVEVSSDGHRKLRYCFLYTDLLLCAKEKTTAGMFHHPNKVSYECKWYIQLADLSFEPFKDSDQLPEYRQVADQDLREYSQQAQQIKIDIMKERKRHQKSSSRRNQQQQQQQQQLNSPCSRREERLHKKLADYNTRIVLYAPNLPLKLYHQCGKSYLFLMSSDYERIEWQESIMKQQETCFKSFPLTTLEITTLLNENVRPKKIAMSGMMMGTEDELLSGYLTVTIHSAKGFLTKCNPYCCLEVDSFGQFQTKAKTRHCADTSTPCWEEEFELEVDGAQQLRILIFEKTAGNFSDETVLIAKTKIALNKDILGKNGQWNHTKFLFNEIEIECSFIFVPREHSLQRLPSKATNGVFGVKIDQVGRRDSSGVPSVVRKLIEEVERRGMDEVGIYRVSGVVSGITALKVAFDSNRKDVCKIMSEVDVNAVAGVLKLYFRELPEPLFTNARYRDFVEASSLTDEEIKLTTFRKLLADLPVTNYKTLYYLRQHLIKVARNESANKMNLQNIATVFGPTLLRPADTGNPNDPNQLNNLRLDVHFQMDVLLFVLERLDMLPYEQLRAANKQAMMVTSHPRHRPYEEILICPANTNPTIVTSAATCN